MKIMSSTVNKCNKLALMESEYKGELLDRAEKFANAVIDKYGEYVSELEIVKESGSQYGLFTFFVTVAKAYENEPITFYEGDFLGLADEEEAYGECCIRRKDVDTDSYKNLSESGRLVKIWG